jgi:hypothetical protein
MEECDASLMHSQFRFEDPDEERFDTSESPIQVLEELRAEKIVALFSTLMTFFS